MPSLGGCATPALPHRIASPLFAGLSPIARLMLCSMSQVRSITGKGESPQPVQNKGVQNFELEK